MKTSEKNQLVKGIYDVIYASGLTSHKYKNDDFRMVYEVRNVINRYLFNKGLTMSAIIFNQFLVNKGDAKCFQVSIEDIFTAEPVVHGQITACSAGTIENHWSSYDICANWWACN